MFLSPWGLLGLIALPLILLLYILKQKREKITVSSLYLWRQVLQDMQARTPWQKLRKNLLLFLQLLAALLIVLALARFALSLGEGSKESVILAMDASLSMSSTDILPTRLEAAKDDAMEFIHGLSKNSRVTLVSLGRDADILLYKSTSKDEVFRSIQAIEPTTGYLDMSKAEELLLSLKKQDAAAEIVLFGDKPVRVGNETIQFSNYEKQSSNLALIRFTHTRAKDKITGMSILRNQGDSDVDASISLYGDGTLLDSQRVTVAKKQTQTVWWQDIPSTIQSLECRIDSEDILQIDNHAYDAVALNEGTRVLLITSGNVFLEKVFSLIEGVELVRTLPEEITEYKGHDLYVFDGAIPEKLPEDGNIVIFAPQPNSLFPVGDWMDTPAVRPVKHPIFRFLDNISFSIGRTRILEKPEWAEVVMEFNGNPILMEGQKGNTRILIFGFQLNETDLPLKSEFPILMSNIVTEYAPGNGTAISGMITGDTTQFRLQPDTISARVLLPGGQSIAVSPPVPPEPFIQTDTPGMYTLEQKIPGGTISSLFAVNLPDEWTMEDREAIAQAGEADTVTHVPLQRSGTALVLPLLIAVLMILILEWWYYANRNYA